jgi:hypothetical protein
VSFREYSDSHHQTKIAREMFTLRALELKWGDTSPNLTKEGAYLNQVYLPTFHLLLKVALVAK